MSLTVALQMDPVESLEIEGDSTFRLGLEAQARGHRLFYYTPERLALYGRTVTAPLIPLELRDRPGDHFTAGDPQLTDLSQVDVVLMRQDPPFDMAYITATFMLEHIHPGTLVVNDPVSVRNAPEKLFVTQFPDLMPPTLITRNEDALKSFRADYKDIIVKPLFGNGGAGVFRLRADDENMGSLVEMFMAMDRSPLIAQAYLPAVRQGDKRIILVDGEPVGAINRVPGEGEVRANFHAGGTGQQTTLTAREQEICARIGPALRHRGLIFVGIDVIGDYMTEINVTSPTGLRHIERMDGTNIAAKIWDAIEAKVSAGA
ncbi:MAG: glutathione synthase [Alphaproteobacteria bacterium]